MTLAIAALLGLIQGVFMFVPVSSTSHLVLSQTWLRDRGILLPPPESPELILFDLVVHVGTLVSVVVVMGGGLRELGSGVRHELATGRVAASWRTGLHGAVSTRLVALGLLTTAVTGALGLVLRGPLTSVFGSPTLVAVALLVTGVMLWWTDVMVPGRRLFARRGALDPGALTYGWRGPREVTVGVAVAIGVAQAAALTPGLSRSGTTIFVALLLGMRRQLAARYSFYVAIPTILAASGVETLSVLRDGGLQAISWTAMGVGFVVAAVVGSAALWAVLRLLEAARFRVFAVYVWGLAIVVLVTGVGASL
ncbi:undecaprenyl-diphosphate phosphatase [Nitriliruptoraceae bacterium ZYF776]|nr:undecaprenyl-diphosphate phosphatase [Profundirhabdus halotolerans]